MIDLSDAARLEEYACHSTLAAGAFALEHVCAVGAIHVTAFRPETFHPICKLPVIGACSAAMTGATLIVPVHISDPRCFGATTDEALHGFVVLQTANL